MSNPYDKAHELAKSIKDSQEYSELTKSIELVKSDENLYKMVKNFFTLKTQIEIDMLSGKEESKEKKDNLKRLHDLVMAIPEGRKIIESQYRFQRLMGDIYKIIGEAINEGMEFFNFLQEKEEQK
ncbi:Cell fate regulator YlbF [Thermodesulfobium acidiphilum]|uniref:Cell fate regulator YlbF n=1 Tax=Thermodesulfobium acidiphilum TaxID=1794699 RepID=A0A2R4W2E4_THEAF|nr:YlbF family regulator [Thermodesulfobium acidiphilum]AWB10924.1 Cell fate regulator YlbF [Thermodesulfobium acidiphilum]PMP84754.1 MAG: YlbF family regulator [Thermodesulfobium narugense]